MRRSQPILTLFPYTTLFRSRHRLQKRLLRRHDERPRPAVGVVGLDLPGDHDPVGRPHRREPKALGGLGRMRSEEHTSELQSHSDLVCRLLLEKKKLNSTYIV